MAGARTRPTNAATARYVAKWGGMKRMTTGIWINDKTVDSASAKPGNKAAPTAPRWLQRPKMTAARAMKSAPEQILLLTALAAPIVRKAPAMSP